MWLLYLQHCSICPCQKHNSFLGSRSLSYLTNLFTPLIFFDRSQRTPEECTSVVSGRWTPSTPHLCRSGFVHPRPPRGGLAPANGAVPCSLQFAWRTGAVSCLGHGSYWKLKRNKGAGLITGLLRLSSDLIHSQTLHTWRVWEL